MTDRDELKAFYTSFTSSVIDRMNEFENALKSALNSNITTIIDVPINPDEDVFPFVVPNSALKDMVIA